MPADPRLADLHRAVQELRIGHFELTLRSFGAEINRIARWMEDEYDRSQKLQQLTEQVSAGLFFDEVMQRIFDNFRPLIPYDRLGCAMLSEDGSMVKACWARSDTAVRGIETQLSAPFKGSSLETILHKGEPRTINDLEQYSSEHPESRSTKLMIDQGARSSLTCPLVAQGRPLGFLFFSSRRKDTYQPVHHEVFMRIGSQLSILVEKSRLYQQLHELNESLRKAHENLERQATRDPLTQVLNRGAAIEVLEKEIGRAARSEKPLGLMMVDVDYFKEVNDRLGHLAGDAVLREVARRIRETVRTHDHVGRYGGEEFLIVLTDPHNGAGAMVGERIRKVIAAHPFNAGSQEVKVTVSIGAVVADMRGVTADGLIEAADEALYRAKQGGRDRVEFREFESPEQG